MVEKTKKKPKSDLADNIVSRRIALGYRSAEDFAEVAQVPYPTLRDIEAGISKGRIPTIQKIAGALGCTIDDLHSVPARKASSALVSEAVQILTTLDEPELSAAVAGLRALRNASARGRITNNKKGAR